MHVTHERKAPCRHYCCTFSVCLDYPPLPPLRGSRWINSTNFLPLFKCSPPRPTRNVSSKKAGVRRHKQAFVLLLPVCAQRLYRGQHRRTLFLSTSVTRLSSWLKGRNIYSWALMLCINLIHCRDSHTFFRLKYLQVVKLFSASSTHLNNQDSWGKGDVWLSSNRYLMIQDGEQ